MGEDEAARLVKGEQALLVAEDEVVGALVVRSLAAPGNLGVDGPALLIHREVPAMHLTRVKAPQVVEVAGIPLVVERRGGHAGRHRGGVLLLEDAPVLARGLGAVLVVDAVLPHLVYEEERETLDAAPEQRLLLLEVALDCLANLHAPQVGLSGVALRPSLEHHHVVHEAHVAGHATLRRHDATRGDHVALAVGLELP